MNATEQITNINKKKKTKRKLDLINIKIRKSDLYIDLQRQ